MGSLNSDVDDGLDGHIDPTHLLGYLSVDVPPVPQIPPAMACSIHADTAALRSHRAAYEDRVGLHGVLVAQRGLCANDALAIDQIYGGFLGQHIALAEFTQTLSFVRYDSTLRELSARLATETAELRTETTAYTTAVAKHAAAYETYLKTVQLAPLKTWASAHEKHALFATLRTSPHLCVAAKAQFLPLLTTPLTYFTNEVSDTADALALVALKAVAQVVNESQFLRWIDWAAMMQARPEGNRYFFDLQVKPKGTKEFFYLLGDATQLGATDTFAMCLDAILAPTAVGRCSAYENLLQVLDEEIHYAIEEAIAIGAPLTDAVTVTDEALRTVEHVFGQLDQLSTLLRHCAAVQCVLDDAQRALAPLA